MSIGQDRFGWTQNHHLQETLSAVAMSREGRKVIPCGSGQKEWDSWRKSRREEGGRSGPEAGETLRTLDDDNLIRATADGRVMARLLSQEPVQPQLIVRVHENGIDAEPRLVNPPHRRERDGKGGGLSRKMKVKLQIITRNNSFQAQTRPTGNGKIEHTSIPNDFPIFCARTDALNNKSRTDSLLHGRSPHDNAGQNMES